MAAICPVCGNIMKFKVKAADGKICAACSNLTSNYKIETIGRLKQFWLENQKRQKVFKTTHIVQNINSMKDNVFIDNKNQLFFIGNQKTQSPKFYYFKEVSNYTIETVGEKLVTKSKGGVGRAFVGNALFGGVGAVVGATTSKKETEVVGGQTILKIKISHRLGAIIKDVWQPTPKLSDFLDTCIKMNKSDADNPSISAADELLKFKNLLDNGVITQEEFDTKKKQLLNL